MKEKIKEYNTAKMRSELRALLTSAESPSSVATDAVAVIARHTDTYRALVVRFHEELRTLTVIIVIKGRISHMLVVCKGNGVHTHPSRS